MRLLETILVAVDFSESTGDVLHSAAEVARTFRSAIILQSVLPHFGEGGAEAGKLLAMARAGALARLEECRQALEAQGATVRDALVDQGSPSCQIVGRAEELDVNVVMLAATGCPGRSPPRLGTTADGVRRQSAKPVWLVKPGRRQPHRSLLCPVDSSPASERALRNAVHLARQLEARLTLMTVIPSPGGWTTALFTRDAAAENEQADREADRFVQFLERFDFHGVRWDKAVCRGEPAEQIIEMVQGGHGDLLVMGSAGRGGLWRMFAGSVTDKVASQIPCSMVTMMGEDAIRLGIDEKLTDIETHYSRGRELLDEGFPEEARRQFQHCVKTNDMFVPAWEALAEAYGRLGEEGRRQECLRTAERIREALSWQMIQAEIRAKHPFWGKNAGNP